MLVILSAHVVGSDSTTKFFLSAIFIGILPGHLSLVLLEIYLFLRTKPIMFLRMLM